MTNGALELCKNSLRVALVDSLSGRFRYSIALCRYQIRPGMVSGYDNTLALGSLECRSSIDSNNLRDIKNSVGNYDVSDSYVGGFDSD
jgi:hypothetical protein